MENFDTAPSGVTGDHEVPEEEAKRNTVFLQLKPYCLALLALAQNPRKDSSAIPALLQLLRTTPSTELQPFFDYTLFPLLLLLDAAVNCRSQQGSDPEEKFHQYDIPMKPHKVSDKVAEGAIQCLEELLKKCHLGSVDQMVVILKKLTNAALLTPLEAAEEFREGVIKCFRALILSLNLCSNKDCSCKQSLGLPTLLDRRNFRTPLARSLKYDSEPEECLLAFLQSQTASAAVGHWLSLLIKAADSEATRGNRGSASLRVEAFWTLRVLVAAVGTADALAFFLPGVVSQFAKVLHVSKTMVSGAAGSVEALDQAIRGLAEYLMIVLSDDVNLSNLNPSVDVNSNKYESTHSFLEELRCLPTKAQDQSKVAGQNASTEMGNIVTDKAECNGSKSSTLGKGVGALHVDRTKDWIQKTASHVNILLSATFPHICVHPAKRVRQGVLAAIRGLLSKCTHTLTESRLMLLECLCVLVVDDSDQVSLAAQEFLEFLFSVGGKHHIKNDVAEIFSRLIGKLPEVVLRSEEALALSHAQQLLVVIYYSGPQFVVDHLRSPITAARFLDVFALCLSQSSAYTGSLDKLILGPSSKGYLPSVADLKSGSRVSSPCQTVVNAASMNNTKFTDTDKNKKQYTLEACLKNYELPRMPPWFSYVGSQKLYQALAGVLRLVGLSLVADFKSEGHLSVVIDIPLGYLRKLVSEVRLREYNREDWQSWYNRTGSGQLVRQASIASCILNEMIFGLSDQARHTFTRMFQKSRMKGEDLQESAAVFTSAHTYKCNGNLIWKISVEKEARNHLIDCVGKILHEYQSPEVWDLPIDNKSSPVQPDGEVEDINLHFFRDTAMLHQVIIEGIGIFSLCLGKDFASSGYRHSSLYLLLESLTCSNFQVRSAADAVLHLLAATSGHPTVGHLVLANADYVVDSICRQLRHLDLNPRVPNVLAAMLSYIGVADKILPLLEEPMRSVSRELEILGRHQHPDLTVPFLKAVAEIAKAAKREASSLLPQAKSNFMHVKSKASDVMKSEQGKSSNFDKNGDIFLLEPEEWENILFELNDSKRYRRTVGSIAGSCLTAATPLLASLKQAECLIGLDIVEDGIWTLAKVEEAYQQEMKIKETIEEVIQQCSFYQLKDTMDAAEDGTDENRMLPAMNKIWPFLVVCVKNKVPMAVRRCLGVISSVVQICGGDFFSRRFHTDGSHFWRLLTTSPFHRKPNLKDEKTLLQLPYRSIPVLSEDSLAEASSLKVQVAVLNMVADLSRNKRSASALEAVLKKVSGLVVGIACSGVVGLHDASLNALSGLACIDPDLIWILLADVYYSLKKKELPLPPSEDLPEISQVLPPPSSPKGFLYVEYGGQSYGFDVDFPSVETVFKKMHSLVFSDQMYS